MKKILYVHQVSSVGGASFCLLNIIKGLDRQKYAPSVLLKENGPLAEEFRKLGVTVFFLPSLCAIPYNKSFSDWRTWLGYFHVYITSKQFAKFLREHHFDLVYLNNMMLYPYLKEIKDCASIIHVREHWPLDEHKKQLAKAQHYVKRYATRVVAINHYSASIFANCSDKADIVYDWIDMSCRHKEIPFNDIFGEDVSNKKVYLFTGGTNWTKGPQTVVDVFVNHMKGDDKRLLILGMKKKQMSNSLKQKIKGVLKLFGRKDSYEQLKKLIESDSRIKCIPSVYEIADIMQQAYCSLSYFAIPHANLALAEGIIMGLPCIAAETSESLEYSKNGKLAMLFGFGNKKAFVEAVNRMENQYIDMKSRLKNEANDVAEMFSASRNIEALNNIYSSIFDTK